MFLLIEKPAEGHLIICSLLFVFIFYTEMTSSVSRSHEGRKHVDDPQLNLNPDPPVQGKHFGVTLNYSILNIRGAESLKHHVTVELSRPTKLSAVSPRSHRR